MSTTISVLLAAISGLEGRLSEGERAALAAMLEKKDAKILALSTQDSTSLQDALVKLAKGVCRHGHDEEGDADVPMASSPQDTFADALSHLTHSHKNRESELKSALKALLKIVQNLQKNPDDLKHRRLRADNITMKKWVTGVYGASNVMSALGFRNTEHGSKPYLELEDGPVDHALLDAAEGSLSDAIDNFDKIVMKRKATPPPTRKHCLGDNCSFFGDEDREGYCSQCYLQKKQKTAPSGVQPMAVDTDETQGTSSSSSSAPASSPKPATASTFSSSSPSSSPSAAPAAAASPSHSQPMLCVKQCGFFGQASLEGMCSVCYGQAHPTKKDQKWRKKLNMAMIKIGAMYQFKKGAKPRSAQKNKKKCYSCRRKVGILGFECKCGYIFCSEHRYPAKHGCDFDHKKSHQRLLSKQNKAVQNEKLEDRIDDDS